MLIFLGIILLFNLSQCLNPSNTLLEEVLLAENDTDFKATFAYEVVDKIYNAFRQWFFTIIFCEFTYFENRILKYTETFDYGYPVMLLDGCPPPNRTKVKPKINKHGRTAYIITSNELSLDVNDAVIRTLKRTGVFKPRRAVIFVINVPVQVDSYFYYSMKTHFQLLCSRRITNSILILWSNRLRMYSYNPFFEEVKEISEVKDIAYLLTKQYYDLYGHELRLSVYRKIYVSDETGPVDCNSRTPKTLMEKLNATCQPLVPRDGNTIGDLLDNGTATGVTADLIDGYTELEFNSRILQNSYYGYIDTTYPLVQDALCFLVKKAGKQSTFMTTLKLITGNILLLFGFIMITLILTALFIQKVEANILNIDKKQTSGATLMDLVKCFIRQTVDIKFIGPVFKAIVLIMIIYSLVIDCVIDGILTSAITYPRYKSDIDTMAELAKTNMTLAVHRREAIMFNKSLTDEYYEIFRNRIEIFDDHKIKEAIEQRQYQYAILLLKSDAEYISRKPANSEYGRPLFHTVRECPVICSMVYGLRYGSPYLYRINEILRHLNQGGILQHWTKTDEYTLYQSHKKVLYADIDNKERKPLNMGNLQEVFIVLGVGLTISTILFFFEILMHSMSVKVL